MFHIAETLKSCLFSRLHRQEIGKTQLNEGFVVINKTLTSQNPLDWVLNLYLRKWVFQNYQNYRILKGPPYEIEFFNFEIKIFCSNLTLWQRWNHVSIA